MTFGIIKHSHTIETILHLTQQGAHGDYSNYVKNITTILGAVASMGFKSVRYYEAVWDVINKCNLLILCATYGMESKKLGYSIGYEHSTIGKSGNIHKPIQDSSNKTSIRSPEEHRWIEDLGLSGKHWVDIPLCINSDLRALIACDWIEEGRTLDQDDLLVLELIASRIAANLAIVPTKTVASIHKHIVSRRQSQDTPGEILHIAASELCQATDAAIIAVFDHSWQSDDLTKTLEVVHPSISTKPKDFPELYDSESTHLTRQAWNHPSYRAICDFNAIVGNASHQVEKGSQDRHTSILGSLKTVHYELLLTKDPRYMLRVMNRIDAPVLPFVAFHKDVIQHVCRILSEDLDATLNANRLRNLQTTSAAIVQRGVENPRHALELIHEGLEGEGFASFALLCHSSTSVGYSLIKGFGSIFSDWPSRGGASSLLWTEDEFYCRHLDKKEPGFIYLTGLSESRQEGHVCNHLASKGILRAICCPIVARDIKGIAIFPIVENPQRKQPVSASKQPKPPLSVVRAVETYTAMAGTIAQAIESLLSAQGARRLVGHIGHELKTPILILSSHALHALALATEKTPESSIEFRKSRRRIVEEMRAINKTMDLAHVVAQESKGVLQLQFTECDLHSVLKAVCVSLSNELESRDSRGKPIRFDIQLSATTGRVGTTVCDVEFVKQALVNILRNAMKYSLPRSPPDPMIISVHAYRQPKMSIIQISNWGLGIDPDEFESIFQPYVRGKTHDHRKAIRGMGLGLYVSRRIVAAHRGLLFCHHSNATLGDPKRIALWEGFETMFEMRLPHGLQPGLHEHVWEREI